MPELDRSARLAPYARAIADGLIKRGVRPTLGATVYEPGAPVKRMFFNILTTFAEFAVGLIQARTRKGMAIVWVKGKLWWKRPKF